MTPIRIGETLLVDGVNVMRANSQDTRLEILMALIVELKRAGGNFCCIFDANAKFQLRKYSGQRAYEAFLRLVSTYPHHFALSTGGLCADELLLQRADSLKQRIVTNDRFNDFRDRYTWLQQEQRHLVNLPSSARSFRCRV